MTFLKEYCEGWLIICDKVTFDPNNVSKNERNVGRTDEQSGLEFDIPKWTAGGMNFFFFGYQKIFSGVVGGWKVSKWSKRLL